MGLRACLHSAMSASHFGIGKLSHVFKWLTYKAKCGSEGHLYCSKQHMVLGTMEWTSPVPEARTDHLPTSCILFRWRNTGIGNFSNNCNTVTWWPVTTNIFYSKGSETSVERLPKPPGFTPWLGSRMYWAAFGSHYPYLLRCAVHSNAKLNSSNAINKSQVKTIWSLERIVSFSMGNSYNKKWGSTFRIHPRELYNWPHPKAVCDYSLWIYCSKDWKKRDTQKSYWMHSLDVFLVLNNIGTVLKNIHLWISEISI